MENKNLFKGKIYSKLDLEKKVKLTYEIVNELVRCGKLGDIGELHHKIFNDINSSSFIIEYRLMTHVELPISIFGEEIFDSSKNFILYDHKTYFISDYKGYLIITKYVDSEKPYKIANYTSNHMRQFYKNIPDILSNTLFYGSMFNFENDIIACKNYLEEMEGFKNNFLNLTSKYKEFKKSIIENKTRKEIYSNVETIAIKKRIYRKLTNSTKKYSKLFDLKNEKYGDDVLEIIYEYYLEFLNYGTITSLETENIDEEIKSLLNSLFSNLWFADKNCHIKGN